MRIKIFSLSECDCEQGEKGQPACYHDETEALGNPSTVDEAKQIITEYLDTRPKWWGDTKFIIVDVLDDGTK